MIDSIPPINGKKIKNIWWDTKTQELVFDVEESVLPLPTLHTEAGCLEVDDLMILTKKKLANTISRLINIDVGIINQVYGGEKRWK